MSIAQTIRITALPVTASSFRLQRNMNDVMHPMSQPRLTIKGSALDAAIH